jgi:hypothetical protein
VADPVSATDLVEEVGALRRTDYGFFIAKRRRRKLQVGVGAAHDDFAMSATGRSRP